jgi:hypothetical protein
MKINMPRPQVSTAKIDIKAAVDNAKQSIRTAVDNVKTSVAEATKSLRQAGGVGENTGVKGETKAPISPELEKFLKQLNTDSFTPAKAPLADAGQNTQQTSQTANVVGNGKTVVQSKTDGNVQTGSSNQVNDSSQSNSSVVSNEG